jgi:hypothetical protein
MHGFGQQIHSFLGGSAPAISEFGFLLLPSRPLGKKQLRNRNKKRETVEREQLTKKTRTFRAS